MTRPTTRRRLLARVGGEARRAHRRAATGGAERGAFAALELAILLPFVLVMLLLVVGFGRVEHGRELVDQAARPPPGPPPSHPTRPPPVAATEAAKETLRNGGLSCTGGGLDAYADTANFGPAAASPPTSAVPHSSPTSPSPASPGTSP